MTSENRRNIEGSETDNPGHVEKRRRFKFICPLCYALYEFHKIELTEDIPKCDHCNKVLVRHEHGNIPNYRDKEDGKNERKNIEDLD